MYAVIRQGGHQYRVAPGDIVRFEKIDSEKGENIVIDEVLLLATEDGTEIGEPRLSGVEVQARVLRNDKGEKIRVYKFRRRKGYSKTKGHRQNFTEVMITGVTRNGAGLS